MKLNKLKNYSLAGLFFVFFCSSIVLISGIHTNGSIETDVLPEQLSTANGLILFDDEARNDTVPAATDYHYATGTCLPARYHLIWLLSRSPSDFNLFVYRYAYHTLQASSGRTGNLLDWVVFRPNDTVQYYTIINSTGGGSAHIEWEDSSTSISLFGNVEGTLNESEAGEIFEVFLNQTSSYDFQLELGIGADFDLYLYSLEEGEAANYDGAIAQSTTTGVQTNEALMNYLPPSTGKYALVIVRRSGSGTFTLRFDRSSSSGGIPSFEFIPLLLGFSIGILLTLISSKKPKITPL